MFVWYGLARKLLDIRAVEPPADHTKPRKGKDTCTRFSSRLVPFTNALLAMRYTDKKSVASVLEWLVGQGVTTSRDSYQMYLRRVLNLLPDDKASAMKVDLELLRAIRRRLRLPLAPPAGRALTVKAVKSFNARSRQRRIAPVKKAKSVRAPLARSTKRPRFEADQLPLAGIVATSSPVSLAAKMRGTPEAPQGYGDWKIINEIAREKLMLLDRHLYPNMEGTVIHLKTRKLYSEEELVTIYKLTPTEAQSCFMTFNDTATFRTTTISYGKAK